MKFERNVTTGLVSVAALAGASDVVAAQDWNGAYAGLSINKNSGTSPAQPYVYDEGYQMGSDATVGGFAGYRWSAGENAVMGFEVAVQTNIGVDAPASQAPIDGYSYTNLIDAKFSLGIPVNKALVYGFAGVSSGVLNNPDDDNYSATGANYGVGVDYKVNDRFSVGLEYISRNMTGYTSGGNPDSQKNASTISLRTSIQF